MRARRDTVTRVRTNAGVVDVARGKTADSDNKGSETRLSPLLRITIILNTNLVSRITVNLDKGTYIKECRDMKERYQIVRCGEVALHEAV